MNNEVSCLVYSETYEGACDIILGLDLPIVASDYKGLNKCLIDVWQVTEEDYKEDA